MKYQINALKFLPMLAALPLAIGGALYSPGALAQSDDDEASLLEEVVVTARYREERLQETPIAITAITAEEIDIRGFTDSYELGYTTPNASLRPAQQAFGNTMTAYIRGIGQYDFDFAFEPGVGVYIDDIYHPFTMGSQIDLLDLDHVEVLRGPQGTLFGRGSIGGAIRYVSAPPKGDNSGNVKVTVGEFERVDVRASYDFTLAEGLYARLSGVSKKRDGFQKVYDFPCLHPDLSGNLNPVSPNRAKDCVVGTQGGQDVTGARGSLRWIANDDVELRITAEYLDDNSEARADTLTDVAPVFGLYEGFYLLPVLGLTYDSRFLPPNQYVTYATFADPRSGLAFKPETAFQKFSTSAVLDWSINENLAAKFIVSSTDIDGRFAVDADASPLNIQTVDGIQTIESETYEFRLSGRAFDRLDWTVGAFQYDGFAINDQTVSIPWLSFLLDMFLPNSIGPSVLLGTLTFEEAAALLDSDPTTYTFVNAHNEHDATNTSFFAHGVYDLNDRMTLNVGVRYSEDEKKVDFDNTRVQNPSVLVKDDHTDWKVGLDYKATDNVMVYGSVASGYRPGAYNSRPFQATQVVAVQQEESTAYELGVKGDFLDNTLRLNLAVFYTDWDTRILPVGGTECPLLDLGPPPVYLTVDPSTPGAVQDSLGNYCTSTVSRTFYANAPAEITGVEAEFTWRPTDEFTLSGQLGLLDWKSPDIDNCDFNLDGVPDPGITCISDLPSQVPDENWSLSAAYRFDLANGGSVTPRVDFYSQSKICFGPTFEVSCADGYDLLNASVVWANADADWMVQLGVTNLGDEEYWLNSFDLTGFGQPHGTKQPGRPSEWFLSFTRNFN